MASAPRQPEHYFGPRSELLAHVPATARRILDVGCGPGETARALRERGGVEIVGIEVDEGLAAEAGKHCDRVFSGDVERIALPFDDGYFDCILYGDVLEHLVDPWTVVREQRRLLADDGVIICSIPNVQHYRVLKKVIAGTWQYVDDGIMDRGHLRFFTWKSVLALLKDAGYTPLATVKRPSGAGWLKLANKAFGNRLIPFLVRQYIVVAGKQGRGLP